MLDRNTYSVESIAATIKLSQPDYLRFWLLAEVLDDEVRAGPGPLQDGREHHVELQTLVPDANRHCKYLLLWSLKIIVQIIWIRLA